MSNSDLDENKKEGIGVTRFPPFLFFRYFECLWKLLDNKEIINLRGCAHQLKRW